MRTPVLLLAALLCAGGAPAQTVTQIDVSAPRSTLIAGDSMQLTATARDAPGNIVERPLVWFAPEPEIISVDQNGRVTGQSLGLAPVAALTSEDGPIGVALLQVLPSRVEIIPQEIELFLGSEKQYAARAYDINGRAMPGVEFYWNVMGPTGYETSVAQVDQAGMLRATGIGRATVQATFEYPFVADRFVPVLIASATVNVAPRQRFHIERLLSTGDIAASFSLRPSYIGGIAANDAGEIAFLGSLDGLTTAPLRWRGRNYDLLARPGAPALLAGSMMEFFFPPSLNSAGETFFAYTGASGGGLVRSDGSDMQVVLLQGQSIGPFERLHNFRTGRTSLNAAGEGVCVANFERSSTDEQQWAVFRVPEEGNPLVVASSLRPPEGLSQLRGVGETGIDESGTVYFVAGDGETVAVYEAAPGGQPVKVLGLGDLQNAGSVEGISRLNVGADGSLALALAFGGKTNLPARRVGGAFEALPVNHLENIHAVSAAAGVLFTGDTDFGYGLHQWLGGDLNLLIANGSPGPTGINITRVDSAAATPDGSVYAQVRTDNSDFEVLRLAPQVSRLIAAGDPVNVEASPFPGRRSIVPGREAGDPHLLLGVPGSVFRMSGREPVEMAALGATLPDGSRFRGAGLAAEDSAGNIYLTGHEGTFRKISPNGQVETILGPAATTADVNVYTHEPFAVNDRRWAVISGNADGAEGLYLWNGTSLNRIAFAAQPGSAMPSPAGGNIVTWYEAAIDGAGRVMALFIVAGGPSGYFLYDNGEWTPTVLVGSPLDGQPIQGAYALTAQEDSFYSLFVLEPDALGGVVIGEFAGGQWGSRLTSQDVAGITGEGPVYFTGLYDANIQGDLLVSVFTPFGPTLVLNASGGTRIVHLGGQALGSGELLTAFQQIDLRNDRSLYFIATDTAGLAALYSGVPFNSAFAVPLRSRQTPPGI